MVEHGIFPSAMKVIYDEATTSEGDASDDAHLMAFMLGDVTPSNGVILGGDKVEEGEHGSFPSPKEAYGVERTEHSPTCLSDDMVPIPCEYESHLAHLSESKSEMSDSTICEIECFNNEGMSDTPSELREVVDRSRETILISNNLPSTSSVFSPYVLGSMDGETPTLDMMMPRIEKMYMEDEDDATPWIH
jgi:hypothetical protein